MILVNLLRHDVRIETADGNMTIPASGKLATVVEQPKEHRTVDVDGVGHVPVTTVETSVVGMPDPMDDVGYIVTYKTLHALHILGADTTDVYAPDLLIKTVEGKVVGCRQLMQMKPGDQ